MNNRKLSRCVMALLMAYACAQAGENVLENNELEHECTSWALFPDVTGGKMMLHKNRDAKWRGIVICRKAADAPGNHWIGLGNVNSPCMGLNDKGLAIVMNSGEATFENEPGGDGRMGTPAILQFLLETAGSAKEAAEHYREIIRQRKYTHEKKGSIFFFLDTHEGYLAENTAHHLTVVPLTGGYTVRANIWHNPGMAKYSRNTCTATLNSCSREYQVILGLNEALEKRSVITLEDVWNVSRARGDIERMGNERGVCGKTTNSAATLVPDLEYPDVLSTEYVTIGPPGHTLFLPVPICIDRIPEDIADGSWSKAAFARLDAEGLAFDSSVWNKRETEMLADYQTAQSKARSLLQAGKRDDAVNTMRQAFTRCYDLAKP